MLTEDQSEVIEFLASSSAYGGATVERIDTHSAIVFLAGRRAYKLKRAVRFDYLDFSTAERRRTMCDAEVQLNQRTAPTVYRGVVPITRERDGTIALSGAGTPIDWVVEMHRFPQEALFDRLAADGRLALELMPPLATAIAEFHAAAGHRRDHGGKPGIAWVIEGNAAGFADNGVDILDPAACRQLTEGARVELDVRGALLDARRASGFSTAVPRRFAFAQHRPARRPADAFRWRRVRRQDRMHGRAVRPGISIDGSWCRRLFRHANLVSESLPCRYR